jgi:hypothetical protein
MKTSILGAALLIAACTSFPAAAQVTSTAEFFGATPSTIVPLGHSVAITDSFILAGRPTFKGEVLVLDVKTGAQRRVLRAPLPLFAFDDFGRSIAAGGNLALVGAPTVDGRGAAYLMSVSNGAVIRSLQPVTVAPGDRFGDAVALTGRYLVVAAPSTDDIAGLNQGAVYVFDALTGNLLHRLLAPDAAADDGFGYSVAVSGHYIAVGAPGKNSSQGRVYVFDAVTGVSLGIPDPLAIAAGNKYGNAVAISGGKLLAGAPNAGGGSGLLVVQDISTGTVLHTETWVGGYGRQIVAHGRFFAVSASAAGLSMVTQGLVRVFEVTHQTMGAVPFRQVGQFTQPAPVATGEFLGTSIALNDDTLVAGSPGRTHMASVVGSVVKFGPLTSQLDTAVDAAGHREVARRGQGTPDRAGTAFDSFTQLALAPSSTLTTPRLVFDAGLTGRRAAWGSDTNLDGHLFTLARTGDTFSAGVAVTDFMNPVANFAERSVALAKLGGPGVTSASNEAVLMSIQRSSFAMLRKGDLVSGVPVTRLGQPRMSTNGFVVLNAKVNTGGSNDSGFLVYDNNGTYLGNRTEGSFAPGLGVLLGEFNNRMAMQGNYGAYSAALQTTPAFNQAVFVDSTFIAQRGIAAPGVGFGQVFSTFLGESINNYTNASVSGELVFRATLSGPGINAANNEGLWSNRNDGVLRLVVRKGDAVTGLPIGVVVQRIVNFAIAGSGSVLVQAQLRGPGINASNDMALISYGLSATAMILREGDGAPGCGTARIGTLSLVHQAGADDYAVLATLTGSGTGNNQALFTGFNVQRFLFGGVNSVCDAQPHLLARKGQRFARTGSSVLKSIALPGFLTDGSGAGATGLARLIGNNREVAARLTFTDNESAAVVLKP